MAGGRPTKYDPLYCEALIEHMGKGLSYEAFAGSIQVSKKTLYSWEKEFPEFLNAKEIGIEKSRLWWELVGQDGLFTEYQGTAMNASVWVFNMKNRFQWRDRQPDEVAQISHNTLTVTDARLEELVKIARGEK